MAKIPKFFKKRLGKSASQIDDVAKAFDAANADYGLDDLNAKLMQNRNSAFNSLSQQQGTFDSQPVTGGSINKTTMSEMIVDQNAALGNAPDIDAINNQLLNGKPKAQPKEGMFSRFKKKLSNAFTKQPDIPYGPDKQDWARSKAAEIRSRSTQSSVNKIDFGDYKPTIEAARTKRVNKKAQAVAERNYRIESATAKAEAINQRLGANQNTTNSEFMAQQRSIATSRRAEIDAARANRQMRRDNAQQSRNRINERKNSIEARRSIITSNREQVQRQSAQGRKKRSRLDNAQMARDRIYDNKSAIADADNIRAQKREFVQNQKEQAQANRATKDKLASEKQQTREAAKATAKKNKAGKQQHSQQMKEAAQQRKEAAVEAAEKQKVTQATAKKDAEQVKESSKTNPINEPKSTKPTGSILQTEDSVYLSQISKIDELYDKGKINDQQYGDAVERINKHYTNKHPDFVNEAVSQTKPNADVQSKPHKQKNKKKANLKQKKQEKQEKQEQKRIKKEQDKILQKEAQAKKAERKAQEVALDKETPDPKNFASAEEMAESANSIMYDFSLFDDIQDAYDSNDISKEQYDKYLKDYEGPIPSKAPEIDTIEKTMTGEGYSIQVKDAMYTDIEIDGSKYEYRDGSLYDIDADSIVEEELLGELQPKINQAGTDYMKGLTDDEWDAVIKNPEKYGFDGRSKQEILGYRKNLWDNDVKKIQAELEKDGLSKKRKKELTKELDEANLKKTKVERIIETDGIKSKSKAEKKTIRDDFKDASKNIEYNSDEYWEKAKETQENLKNIRDAEKVGLDATNKIYDGKEKALTNKGLTLNKAINTAFSIKTGIDKYKEERAEGHGVVSSTVQALGSVAVAEILGPTGSIAYEIAKAAPAAAIKGTEFLYKENRRMNSASNFRPLGGTSFQDTQDLATMRQSGMELAKMSQYNLEQTLMGAEAKHLHR